MRAGPVRWGLRALAALAGLGVAALAAVWLTSTKAGPVPATAPGFSVVPVAAAHRDGPLSLHLWYPAKGDTAVGLIGQNALFFGFHGRRDASADGARHPLVVLSHGSGGNALRLGWIASALAARGFIVAAVDHPGTTSGDSLPEATVRPWERAADVTAILDALLDGPERGPERGPLRDLRPDPERIAVMGFSLGGATALVTSGARLEKDAYLAHCARHAGELDCGWLVAGGLDLATIDAVRYEAPMVDPRIRATVAVDPALHQAMTAASFRAIAHPVLVVNLGLAGAIPDAMRAEALAAGIPGGVFREIAGAGHFSFLARCSRFGVFVIGLAGDDNICSDSGLRPRAEVHAALEGVIGDFLETALAR